MLKPKLATTGKWDPSPGKQYLSVSRILLVTASSVVEFNAFKKVQKFMRENNYQIIPTSPDGHEYLTDGVGASADNQMGQQVFCLCVFKSSGAVSGRIFGSVPRHVI